MKTQKKGLANILKRIAITSLIMTFVVSCGQNNTSGDPNNLNGLNVLGANGQIIGQGINFNNYGQYAGSIQRLVNLSQCTNYGGLNGQQAIGQRVAISIPIQGRGNLYKPVVGVTVEGDIAIVRSAGNGYVMDVLACVRPGMTQGQGQVINVAQPLSYSFSCMDGLVADVAIPGNYRLVLFPATPNQQAAQQICGI